MRKAIHEARKGIGFTGSNPTVGAVIVRNGRLVGAGWHRQEGGPHAEVEALRVNPRLARGATLYVTLEPCSTSGKTPPCTTAIVEAGITRVVYGATDPNPKHCGRAKALLTRAGLDVREGVLADDCAMLNEAWNKWIRTGLPLVTAKAAMSLDGKISSPPGRRWITSPEARREAMHLRASCGAVLVGGGTLRDDNPRLTVRGIPFAAQPLRVIWTKSGNLPADASVFIDGNADRNRVFKGISLRKCLRQLGKEGVQSVLIEGGGRTLGEAFDRKLVDRIVFFIAPVILGGPVPAVGGKGVADFQSAPRLGPITTKVLGGDLCLEARVLKED